MKICDKKEKKMAECTLSSGLSHCLFVDNFASVWGCGSNQYGELGLGDSASNILIPQKISNLPPIISVSAGWHFSLFLDITGTVWSCGNNHSKQLGLGDHDYRKVPGKITYLPKIISVIALGDSSRFLAFDGSVWACGANYYGQLGLGDTRNRNKAEKIQGLPKIKAIAGGFYHALFLDYDGSVWACGSNEYGELGLEDKRISEKPEKIPGLPKIQSIAGGEDWSMFVDEQGDVWVCGGNRGGELGLGSHTRGINFPQKNENVSGIVAVGGGRNFNSVFLDKAGNIYTCGSNEYGQLGLGDTTSRYIPEKVNNIPPISRISCCNSAFGFFQIVDWEGRVWSCGYNKYVQLGLGHTNPTYTFQRVEAIQIKLPQTTIPTEEDSENQISIEIQEENLIRRECVSISEFIDDGSCISLTYVGEKARLERTLFLTRNLKNQKLENFILQRVLGSGSNGIVFLCQVQLGEQRFEVALKMIFNFAGRTTNSLKGEYENECLILHKLQSIHPNVIHILWEFVDYPTNQMVEMVLAQGIVEDALFSINFYTNSQILKRTQFFVLEYHPMTLKQILQLLGSTIERERIYRYSLEIVECFMFLFNNHIVHMDVNLDNIFVSEDDRIILGDFGESIETDEFHRCQKQHLKTGNSWFAAPEVLNSIAAAKRMEDWIDFEGQYAWEVGCLLFFISFGAHPFPDYPLIPVNLEVEFPQDRAEIPNWMRNLVVCLLKKDKQERMKLEEALEICTRNRDAK